MEKVFNYVVKTSGNTKLNPKTINIDGSEDPFYRYKMRQLYVQVVGKGKMIKTVLLNIDDVAKDLKVAPSYMTAFIGYEIGAQYKYDAKKPEREKASISGDIQVVDLSTIVKEFIQKVILCPKCKLPETTMRIDKKTQIVSLTCRSCGEASNLILRPKFQQFILNHPSLVVTHVVEQKLKQKQEEATTETPTKPVKPEENGEPNPEKAEKREKKPRKKKNEDDENDIEWSVDTSVEAIKQRRREMLPDSVRQLVVAAEKDKDPCTELRQFLQGNNRTPEEIVAEVVKIQNDNGFSNFKRSALLFEVFFKSNEIPKPEEHKQLLSQLLSDEESQLGLLDCIEKLCTAKDATDLLNKSAIVVKQFYDSELLEEEVVINWYNNKLANARLKKEIAPFVKWLQEAEEESEEEEEEE